MQRAIEVFLRAALLAICTIGGSASIAQSNAKQGEYLATASGCFNCHTSEKPNSSPFTGGRALKTPFGTFYGPNITPHRTAGLGSWTQADFMRAIREGRRPDGAHYYPAFPYPSFTKMSDTDIQNLWAFMRMIPPDPQPNRAHELRFPFAWRPLIIIWKWLFFIPGPMIDNPTLTTQQARGAYLVNALGHCSECHTPRNFLGGPKNSRFLAGGEISEGLVPNLTPTRLKSWSDDALKNFFKTGLTPDGDATGDAMDEVVTKITSKLSPEDLAALIAYLRSLPALPNEK